MLDAVGDFLVLLRARGLQVSPAEALDAVRALERLGIDSRETVRFGLRMTCAKDAESTRRFDHEFEQFFATLGRPRRTGDGAPGVAMGHGRGRPREGDPNPLATRGGERRKTEAEPLARKLCAATQRRSAQASEKPRLRRVVLAPPKPTGSTASLKARPGPVVSGLRARPELQPDPRSPTAAERARASEAARRLAELRLSLGRRLTPGRRGRFSARRTVRASLRTGGVPFTFARDRRSRQRPRIVLLLDVSYSVAEAAGLLLLLSAEFLQAIGRTRVYAFVDRAIDSTDVLLAWARCTARAPGGASFATALHGLRDQLNLDAASDYGRVFFGLEAEFRELRGDFVLVIVGDGRSNRFDRLEWAFADLAARARRVLWLVPEEAARWGTGDSALGEYLPHADIAIEAADLDGLVCAVKQIVREVAL